MARRRRQQRRIATRSAAQGNQTAEAGLARKRRYITYGVVASLLVVASIIVTVILAQRSAGGSGATSSTAVTAAMLPGQFFPDEGRQHLESGQTFDAYNSNPPTSGPHAQAPAKWGVYDQPILKEVLIHNLEHGGVLLLYRCISCTDQIQQLKSLAERYLNRPGFDGG